MNEITPNLWLGDMSDAQSRFSDPSTAIVCVLESNPFPQGRPGYYWMPFLDPLTAKAHRTTLDSIAIMISSLLGDGKSVLVHCAAGIERSPLAVAWYLVWAKLQPDLESAYAYIRERRPQVADRRIWVE